MFLLSVPAPNKPFRNGLSNPVQIMSQVKRLTLGNVFDTVICIENITKDVCDSHPDDYVYRLTLLSAKNEKSYVEGNLDQIYKVVQVTVQDLRKQEMNSEIMANFILKGIQTGVVSRDELDDYEFHELASTLCENTNKLNLDLDEFLVMSLVEIELQKIEATYSTYLVVKMVFLDQNIVEEFSSTSSIIEYFSLPANRKKLPDIIYASNTKIGIVNSNAASREVREKLSNLFLLPLDGSKPKRFNAKNFDKNEAIKELDLTFAIALKYVHFMNN